MKLLFWFFLILFFNRILWFVIFWLIEGLFDFWSLGHLLINFSALFFTYKLAFDPIFLWINNFFFNDVWRTIFMTSLILNLCGFFIKRRLKRLEIGFWEKSSLRKLLISKVLCKIWIWVRIISVVPKRQVHITIIVLGTNLNWIWFKWIEWVAKVSKRKHFKKID